ncbi:hypothetical protein NCS52_00286800 [Fusarium sp. LHS14.1]|nr:hypothetical protein NCS52_00286800 [Fusarium sp. LHS14.1]
MAQSDDDLDEFPSWVHDDELWKPRFQGDPRWHRRVMHQLKQVLVLEVGHRHRRWGFAIVRTAYGPGSDEQFRHALALIGRIVQVEADSEAAGVKEDIAWKKKNSFQLDHIPVEVDTRPNDEIVRRYENDVLEDDKKLEGASVATVRKYFNRWIMDKEGTSISGDMRYAACIMLDAETLAQLATAPRDFPPEGSIGLGSPYWVKMVEAKPKPEDTFLVHVFGEYGLVQYWFDRNYRRRSAIEMTHTEDPENPGIRCFGLPPSNATLDWEGSMRA